MTFQPVVPTSGVAGYLFMQRTQDSQQAVFDRSPTIAREVAYFTDNAIFAVSAEALVNDYRLLRVALGAFGLDEDISKKAFIRKVLEEGTENDEAFANRLVDPRYRALADAFGYGNLAGPQVFRSGFAGSITDAYKVRAFEVAVGEADNSIRLAMNFKREIAGYANSGAEPATKWFQVMGNTPMRSVLETAFGLPSSMGALDIDRQLEIFEDRTASMFGSSGLEVFQEPENVDRLINNFLARDEASRGPSASTPGFAALSLLQAGQLGPTSTANLLLSNV